MIRGIAFQLDNKYGNSLERMLQPLDVTLYDWYIGGDESYLVSGDQIIAPLFPDEVVGLDGRTLHQMIKGTSQYLIFANLKAYPKGRTVIDVLTFEEYEKSDCHFILLITDCIYVEMYCKDQMQIEALYHNALANGYQNVEYTTEENDGRTRLSVW